MVSLAGSRSYANFDLRLGRADQGYTASVTGSPAGASDPVSFVVPFTPDRLEVLLMHLEPWRVRTRRVVDAPTRAAQELGGALFEALLHGSVGGVYRSSLGEAPDGLRFRIDLTLTPELAGLPWELLYDRAHHRHVALSERTPLVRYLEVTDPPRPLPVTGPLRVLGVLSSPVGLEPLDLEAEWSGVQTELAAQVGAAQIVLDRLERPTLADLHRYLRLHDVHVLHLVGHGDFDVRSQDGVLYLEDEHGRPRAVTSSQVGPHLYDHDPLRLVVLNACQTASADRTDAYSGFAQGLVQQGVPAVVAMQVPISDGAAVCFSRDFYTAIAAGQPVDQAITGARKALLTDFGYEWATPVLFLRAADGVLFTEAGARPDLASVAQKAAESPPTKAKAATAAPPVKAATTGPPPKRATTAKRATPKKAATPPTSDAPSTAPKPRRVRNPRTGDVTVVATPPAEPDAWQGDLLTRLRVVTAESSAPRTWGKVMPLVDALPPGASILLNRPRHSAETYIQTTRTESGYDLQHRSGGKSRWYRAHVDTATDAKRVIHAWLHPPADPAGRHTSLARWTRITPDAAGQPEGGTPGVDDLRAELTRLASSTPGATPRGAAARPRTIPFDVRRQPAARGDGAAVIRVRVLLAGVENTLVIDGERVQVNGGVTLPLRKRTWTQITLATTVEGRGAGTVRGEVRAAGWFSAPALRLGPTDINLSQTHVQGEARAEVSFGPS